MSTVLESVAMNDEGFMADPNEWTKEIAEVIAAQEGIEALTENHWKIINFFFLLTLSQTISLSCFFTYHLLHLISLVVLACNTDTTWQCCRSIPIFLGCTFCSAY